jgi:lipid A 3-O-deacylase
MKTRPLILLGGLAALLLLRPAEAEPPPDPAAVWTFQDENASISTSRLTDRYYVNGLLIGWTSPTGATPDFLAKWVSLSLT